MKVLGATAVIGVFMLVIGAVGADDAAKAKPRETTWSFDADKPDKPPAGFSFGRTGGGKEGKWVVLAAKDAPSGGNVLAQVDADKTDNRFPVAVADSPSLADLALSVKCKQVSGEVLQVSDGSLYPALHKLEQEGWIEAEWKPTENNRRAKFYKLTYFKCNAIKYFRIYPKGFFSHQCFTTELK